MSFKQTPKYLDKKNKIKQKHGRPCIYTKKLGEEICEEIRNSVRSIEYICKNLRPDFPNGMTIRRWLNEPQHESFHIMYAEAKQYQADLLADEIIEVSYNAVENPRNGSVDKAKLQVDALKWVASRLNRGKWGDSKIKEEIKTDILKELSLDSAKEKMRVALSDILDIKNK